MLQILARWACIPFSLLGAWVCMRWAESLYGSAAGSFALVMWCVTPYLLGYGATVTADAQAAAVGVAAAFCYWKCLNSNTWLATVVAGAVLGAAVLCKFTLLVLYPLLPLLWAVNWRDAGGGWRSLCGQGVKVGSVIVISILVVNAGYLFDATCRPLGDYRFQSRLFTGSDVPEQLGWDERNRFIGTWLERVPVPLPADLLEGMDTQRCDFERGLPSYLGGEWAENGWWYYYLYALALKIPLGTWGLALLAIAVPFLPCRYTSSFRDEVLLLAPGLALVVFVSSQSGFSVHSRYIIPALPFFLIWLSKSVQILEMRCRDWRCQVFSFLFVVCFAWSAASSLWVYPHSLSYFNELVAGPDRGGKYLMDSNVDWGQDLFPSESLAR